jgi:hypothetical protein
MSFALFNSSRANADASWRHDGSWGRNLPTTTLLSAAAVFPRGGPGGVLLGLNLRRPTGLAKWRKRLSRRHAEFGKTMTLS